MDLTLLTSTFYHWHWQSRAITQEPDSTSALVARVESLRWWQQVNKDKEQQLYQHLAGDDPPCAYINGSNLWTAPYINFIHAVTRPPYRSPGAVWGPLYYV